MPTTLIDNINNKIENSKKEVTKIEFLTFEERQEITEIVDIYTRYFVDWYNKNKGNEKELSIFGGNYDSVKDYIRYDQQVNRVKEIFTNVKKRVNKEEQEEVEMVKKSVLKKMEKLIEGIDYWEDTESELLKVERESLEKYISNNLINHSKINDQIKKKLQEGAKQEEIEDVYWEFDKPQELLDEVKNGKLNEVVIQVIEKGEQDANIHLEAIAASERMNKKIAADLREENREKSKNLERTSKSLKKAEARIKELENKLVEQSKENAKNLNKSNKKLAKAEEKIKMLEEKVDLITKLFTKNLPSLPKKPNKLKVLGKLKTKCQQFKQFIKKQKVQEQELVCQVEVRNNNL